MTPEYERLTADVERALHSSPRSEDDFVSLRLISIELVSEAASKLDEIQRAAFDVACAFRDGKVGESARLACVERIAKRIDESIENTSDLSPHDALDRLVFSALNVNTRLDPYGTDFVIYLSHRAGIDPNAVRKAFRKQIDFRST